MDEKKDKPKHKSLCFDANDPKLKPKYMTTCEKFAILFKFIKRAFLGPKTVCSIVNLSPLIFTVFFGIQVVLWEQIGRPDAHADIGKIS